MLLLDMYKALMFNNTHTSLAIDLSIDLSKLVVIMNAIFLYIYIYNVCVYIYIFIFIYLFIYIYCMFFLGQKRSLVVADGHPHTQ